MTSDTPDNNDEKRDEELTDREVLEKLFPPEVVEGIDEATSDEASTDHD